ncbi:MAG: extracellular solute-binding protein [Phototrophicaceae bacterium]
MKKFFTVLSLLVLVFALPTVAQDEATCTVTVPESATEVNMIGWSFPITDFYAAELELCNDVDNLTVNTQLLASADAQEQVRLALSTGGDSPYDIVHLSNGQVGEWAGSGWLTPLNDLIDQYREEYNLDDIPQTAWDGVTIDGQIYGVPIVSNSLHLIYREDIFEEFGIAVPDNYADVIEACNTIGLDNRDYDAPFTINLSAGWAWEIEFFQFLRAFGGDFLNDDLTPAFNGEEGLQAVELILDVANACMGDFGYSFDLNDQEVAMQLGTLPSTNMWASRAANMSDPERTDLSDVISYAPAPRVTEDSPRAGSAWNDYYAIPATSTVDIELVFQLIMEAADEESQQRAAAVGSTTRLATAEFGGPYLAASGITIAEGIGIYDKHPAIGIVRATLGEFLPLVGTGDLTPQEALDAAAEAYVEEATAQGYIE